MLLRADTRDGLEVAGIFYFYSPSMEETYHTEILSISNTYAILRMSDKTDTVYIHYSSDTSQINLEEAILAPEGHYPPELGNDSPWYIFKICVYQKGE